MKKSEPKTHKTDDATVLNETVAGVSEFAPEQIEELKKRAAKADENWERLLRTTADFDNFKKRAARERTEAAQFANASLLQKLLPILDNFEIQQQLKSVLIDAGLEEIDAGGKPFDPALHEAVSEQESSGVPEGHVLQQLRKGYKLRDRLLRPATVVVAKNPAPNS
jgi:molecular chaperone GrpE